MADEMENFRRDADRQIKEMAEGMSAMNKLVKQIHTSIVGDIRTGEPGIMQRVKVNTDEIEYVKASLKEQKQDGKSLRTQLYGFIAAGLLFLLGGIGSLVMYILSTLKG